MINLQFCNAFIRIGVSGANWGSSYWLLRLVVFYRIAEFMYTDRVINIKEAGKIDKTANHHQ